jgi:signal transduction histidine kinase
MAKQQILTIEDDAAIRRGIVDALRFAGYATLEAADGQSGLEMAPEAGAQTVRTNAAAVEQILFNLVDNACKYASGAQHKNIDVTVGIEGGAAAISVRDYGPGPSAADRRRLFRPFSKSAQEAAHSAPGIGLGLALSRRMARDMGGDLLYNDRNCEGACFVLKLPMG